MEPLAVAVGYSLGALDPRRLHLGENLKQLAMNARVAKVEAFLHTGDEHPQRRWRSTQEQVIVVQLDLNEEARPGNQRID